MTAGSDQSQGKGAEAHFKQMRQKVHDWMEQKKADRTIKKLLKENPVAVLWAADIGFTSLADVQDYILWEITTND